MGHRGGGRGPGENTLASCLQAVSDGATRLELDVQLAGEELVLAHPPAKRSDTVANILAHLTVPIIFHIKRRHYSPWHDRRVIDRLVPLIEGRPIIISSFWPGTVLYAKRHYPGLGTAYASLWAGYDLVLSRRLGVTEYHVWHRTVTRRAVQTAHRKGLQILLFNARPQRPTVQEIRELGADGAFVDEVKAYVTPPAEP